VGRASHFQEKIKTKRLIQVNKMKIRMIAVLMILALAAWLPAMAQQVAAPPAPSEQAQAPASLLDSAKRAATSACAICDKTNDQGKDAKAASCCAGKEMACCKKDSKNAQSAMNCCSGNDGKQCAKNDGKGCCGKDAVACNRANGKNCCAGQSCSQNS
jgi:hypothetical protein